MTYGTTRVVTADTCRYASALQENPSEAPVNELFDTYDERVTQLLARLEADVAARGPPANVEWQETLSAIRQSMARMRGLRVEELDVAVNEQRARLARLGALYMQLSRTTDADQIPRPD
jgi:3'-phosphoadenosine 5'-phosphosulfate sulfotransferase